MWGVSREYNVFDLPDVLFRGDNTKLARMISYFSANPKSAPMALVIGTFYGYLNKLYLCYYGKPDFQNDRKMGIWSHHRKASQRFYLNPYSSEYRIAGRVQPQNGRDRQQQQRQRHAAGDDSQVQCDIVSTLIKLASDQPVYHNNNSDEKHKQEILFMPCMNLMLGFNGSFGSRFLR